MFKRIDHADGREHRERHREDAKLQHFPGRQHAPEVAQNDAAPIDHHQGGDDLHRESAAAATGRERRPLAPTVTSNRPPPSRLMV